MNWETVIQYACMILAGIATAVPLALELVKYAKQVVKEKNWSRLLSLVLTLMQDAEQAFQSGAERKDYVISAVKSLSTAVGYEMEEKALSELIDSLCAMSKVVNGEIRIEKQ